MGLAKKGSGGFGPEKFGNAIETHVFKTAQETPDSDNYMVRVPGLSEGLTALELFARKMYEDMKSECKDKKDRNVAIAANLVTSVTLRAAEFDPAIS